MVKKKIFIGICVTEVRNGIPGFLDEVQQVSVKTSPFPASWIWWLPSDLGYLQLPASQIKLILLNYSVLKSRDKSSWAWRISDRSQYIMQPKSGPVTSLKSLGAGLLQGQIRAIQATLSVVVNEMSHLCSRTTLCPEANWHSTTRG